MTVIVQSAGFVDLQFFSIEAIPQEIVFFPWWSGFWTLKTKLSTVPVTPINWCSFTYSPKGSSKFQLLLLNRLLSELFERFCGWPDLCCHNYRLTIIWEFYSLPTSLRVPASFPCSESGTLRTFIYKIFYPSKFYRWTSHKSLLFIWFLAFAPANLFQSFTSLLTPFRRFSF